MSAQARRIEFGDFQTSDVLALEVCRRVAAMGIRPEVVVEPTCGVGAFVLAASEVFPTAREILGVEINEQSLDVLRQRLAVHPTRARVSLSRADFFATDWRSELAQRPGRVLVVGNLPWVTNSAQGLIGGTNLPEKRNFLGRSGLDAITGKANFDISEWMLLEVMEWLRAREGDVAVLVKTAVARKVLAHAERRRVGLRDASIIGIDAKREFGVSVDASLLVMRFSTAGTNCYDYSVLPGLDSESGRRMGHRMGLSVGDLEAFEGHRHLVGQAPQKWRSGVKHDASAVMELTRTPRGLENGLGEPVRLEPDHLFPLLKGSDIGSGKAWRGRFVLVPQRRVGESTEPLRASAPLTWSYLERHADRLDGRASRVYAKNPRFSIFGVGDYAFRPWRIAICGLYKHLRFRKVGPIEGRPVMFDDTVYYISFDDEADASRAWDALTSKPAQSLLSSLVFWDEKRPVKASVLNLVNWTKVGAARD